MKNRLVVMAALALPALLQSCRTEEQIRRDLVRMQSFLLWILVILAAFLSWKVFLWMDGRSVVQCPRCGYRDRKRAFPQGRCPYKVEVSDGRERTIANARVCGTLVFTWWDKFSTD